MGQHPAGDPDRSACAASCGASAVARAFGDVFAESVGARFVPESIAAAGDLVVAQWRYDWAGANPGHVRGVDLFRIRDGLVAEKRSCVKG